MFKLLSIIFTVGVISASSTSSVQLVVPENSYAILSSGKSSRTAISPPLPPPPSNDVSAEESSIDESENAGDGSEQAAPAPASVMRTTSSGSQSSSSVGSSTSSRTSASSTRTSGGGQSILISSSGRPAPSIQHIVLPPENIPLPIHISTHPGVRTVIAPETITIRERTVAKVGEVVQKIPTSVSHQSQTIVHKHARVVTPIVAPATRTITSQVVRAYHTPLVYSPQGPLVRVVHN